ncbi:MAG: YbhB/YbcL family Raf kinase inhibitor-like protein [Bacteroidota bacterium]|nr:YbhB/YbcL family Raf kinase inhibitor-like protein [Bacteroidota bacterium]
MLIKSNSFKEGEFIPKQFTCDGINISPELSWTDFPQNTKSFAVICDDPDAPAGDWVHWVVYNIPSDMKGLSEAFDKNAQHNNGICQGKTDFGEYGYGGPCPPSGTHRYFFKLYALDTIFPFDKDMKKNKLIKAMQGHIIAEAKLMGKYKRGQ